MKSELSSISSYELIHDFINRVVESANRAELEKIQEKVSVYHAHREKKREELMEAIGTGHGYTTKDTDDIHIGLDLGSGESFSVSQKLRSDNNV